MTSPADTQALIDLVNRIFTAADSRDWDTYRSLMLDQVYVDFAGVGPHRPGLANADQLTANTRAALGSVALTQHMLTNHVVAVDGDRARIDFYEQALHHHPALGDNPEVNTWFLYARATRNAARTEKGWRISAAGLTVVHQTGNRNLLADVAALGSKDRSAGRGC
jgi:SnoaL-like protein